MDNIILLEDICYDTPTGRQLFNRLSVKIKKEKTGIVGRNGVGKTTLLKLIMGKIDPESGYIMNDSLMAYIPQLLPAMTEAEIQYRINDLAEMLKDSNTENWKKKMLLKYVTSCLENRMLSGGEQKLLMILDAYVKKTDFLIMDEPECNLDYENRSLLKDMILKYEGGILLVSHDRELLNTMDSILEIREQGVQAIQGNFDTYLKFVQNKAGFLDQRIKETAEEVKRIDRESEKLVNKQNYRMQKSSDEFQDKGYGDFWCDTPKKDRAAKTLKKLKKKQEEKIKEGKKLLEEYVGGVTLRNAYNIPLANVEVKIEEKVFELRNVSFAYEEKKQIFNHFSISVNHGEKVAFIGKNGAGKTTLIQLILGKLRGDGEIFRYWEKAAELGQFMNIVDAELTVIENILKYNALADVEKVKEIICCTGFPLAIAERRCKNISGGENMITALFMILLGSAMPDIIFMDEPTNHLDMASMVMLENIINSYHGTVILVSHDRGFLENILNIRKIEIGV